MRASVVCCAASAAGHEGLQQSFPDAHAYRRPAGVRAVQLDGVAEAAGRDDEAPVEHVGELTVVRVGELPVGSVVAAVGHPLYPDLLIGGVSLGFERGLVSPVGERIGL